MRYPVRCCCDGTKLYGFLEIPGDRKFRDGETVPIRIMPSASAMDFTLAAEPRTVKSHEEAVMLRRFRDTTLGVDEIAVYSDDRPIEFWRTLTGFTELKPVMEFSTRTTLAGDLQRESEAAHRRALYRPGQVLSMAAAADVCRQSTASINRVFAADAQSMADQIMRIAHPSVSPGLILVGRELMVHLVEARSANSPYRSPDDGNPQTFHGIEIEEDTSLPEGTFMLYLDWEAAVEKLVELRRAVRAGQGEVGPDRRDRTAD